MDEEELEYIKRMMEKQKMEEMYSSMRDKNDMDFSYSGSPNNRQNSFRLKSLIYKDVQRAYDQIYNPDYSGWSMEALVEELKRTIKKLEDLDK